MLWLYREVTCNNKSFFSSDMWGHKHIVKQQERWWSVGEGFYFFSLTRPTEMPSNTLFSDLLYCCRYPIKSSALAHAFYLPFAWTTLLYGTTIISPPPREWFEAVFPTERCWTEIVFFFCCGYFFCAMLWCAYVQNARILRYNNSALFVTSACKGESYEISDNSLLKICSAKIQVVRVYDFMLPLIILWMLLAIGSSLNKKLK